MSNTSQPFGVYKPTPRIQRKINWCHQLPANWLGKQVAQLLRKQVMAKTTLPLDLEFDQVRLRCQLNDNVSERGYVFMPWRWDAIERQVMLKALPAEGVFIDIGANVGIYSAIAATVLNRMGCVVAIEPNPPVFERLKFNLSATCEGKKEKPRIEVLQQGISDQSGEFELFLDAENLGASSLLGTNPEQASIQVMCSTLLEVIDAQKLSRVDVIKCDIEGAEDRALMPFIIDAPRHLLPHCFIFENNHGQWEGELLEVLLQRNYVQTHRTRMNYVFQLRQPIHFASKERKYQQTVPVTS
ncbi:FkbM family methyltransferase [Marinicella litoralis]|uniref:FkbM family methyltransferase n=1 Tax=Marinicella litoralis TaxID=644220 RepID=A0A4R6XYJ9_9GAMM|nr:FkbM family methyltransferase [Marinicella litoralis]TDR23600.1 FkbM family methyltransferase [Marinicella litoralis]